MTDSQNLPAVNPTESYIAGSRAACMYRFFASRYESEIRALNVAGIPDNAVPRETLLGDVGVLVLGIFLAVQLVLPRKPRKRHRDLTRLIALR